MLVRTTTLACSLLLKSLGLLPRAVARRGQLVLALGLVLFFSSLAWAAPGDLDTSFNGSGSLTTALGSSEDLAYDMGIQSDGKIVVVGCSYRTADRDFAVVRYAVNGALDSSFGTGGIVITPIGSFGDCARSVVLQSDGKIVVAGSTSAGSFDDTALARYETNGNPDTSFGTGGKVAVALGSMGDSAWAVLLQSDGKIVTVGSATDGGAYSFALARFTTAGALDASFGTSGKTLTSIGSDDYAYAAAQQSDGKIVAVGEASNGTNKKFALARYDANGILDTSFGTSGKVMTSLGAYDDSAKAVAIQSDGKIVVAGHTSDSSRQFIALARYSSTGVLDSSFGTGGIVTYPLGSGDSYANSVALQPNGKILIGGVSKIAGQDVFTLLRYSSTGSLDASFGSGGVATTAVTPNGSAANAVKRQGDGKIMLAGHASNGANDDFALARYESGDAPETVPALPWAGLLFFGAGLLGAAGFALKRTRC